MTRIVHRCCALTFALPLSAVMIDSVRAVETVCHRGANEHAPENTRAAAQLCIDWGMDYVEIDVRTSKDGIMYILHDNRVGRTTDGPNRRLHDMTSKEIDELDAGSWFSKKFAGQRVPRLEPYLKWVKGKIKVYFDAKDADLEKLIGLIEKLDMEDECFFWFGSKRRARRFRELTKTIPLKINARNPQDVADAKRDFDAQIIETSLRNATPEMISACRKYGIKLMIYHPQKDEAAFRKICEIGADMVNLNHGDVFKKVQETYRAEVGK